MENTLYNSLFFIAFIFYSLSAMKRILAIISTILTCSLASAQSVDVYHSSILSSYSADELEDIAFEHEATGSTVSIHKAGEEPLRITTDNVAGIHFSDRPVDTCTKYADGVPAQVVFSCIEVNNTNPLQHLNFHLRKSNKNLFDAVILFSSNINFSKKEDVVYIHNNENVQPVLNNWEHYIKPLKERGIKVLLSLLGNHDGSGLANLDEQRAKLFAQAIADTLDKYALDGVFFDDEYSEYNKGLSGQGYQGFLASPSYEAASRLAYETKQAIGDKWLVLYKYGYYNMAVSIDGKKPGDYVDYVLTDYNQSAAGFKTQYPGVDDRQIGCYSVNINGYYNKKNVKNLRTGKYGAFMIYNLDQTAYDFLYSKQMTLEDFSDYLFDDELEVTETYYYKDWKTIDELKEPVR